MAAHVRLDELAHVGLLLDVQPKHGVLEELCFEHRTGETRERTQSSVDSDIAWRNDLNPHDRRHQSTSHHNSREDKRTFPAQLPSSRTGPSLKK